jgi:putative intracellular protease/amidase
MGEGEPTGLWLEEFAVPYRMFRAAGHEVTVASPKGGAAPVDPRSRESGDKPDREALDVLRSTRPLSEVELDAFDAVFFPGGHGTMFDLPSSSTVQETVEHFITAGQPSAFVCHGPAALVGASLPDGTSVVKGRNITGFSNEEERAVELDGKMPFLLETRLKELGGQFAAKPNFQDHVVVDGMLVTGQNPASSASTARALLQLLK